jgi:predicted 3-demethylubiquinone-9 3-methyltransferase (glyoxalase superfamily)
MKRGADPTLKNGQISDAKREPINKKTMATTQKISLNLWFDNKAEEAVKFYTSIFKNSSIGKIARYGKAGKETHKMPEGSVMTIQFFLEGQEFMALNGGPVFKFNEAISMIVKCDDQKEIDYYWDKLTAGGDPKSQQCGWLKDKFGVSWQIIPTTLPEMVADQDTEKSQRVMEAIFKMKKIDLETLKKAYQGEMSSAKA